MFWWLGFMVAAIWFAAPLLLWVRVNAAQRELRVLRQRLEALERESASLESAVVVPAVAMQEAAAVASTPPAISPSLPRHDPRPSPAATPVSAAAATPSSLPEGLEDRVGSVWLQNAGAVVLLLGVFFFILWGYTTGRFGAEVLVGTGIGLGLLSAWRGDRLSHSLPRLGHAFIGVGLGIVYLSIYLGHFTLHVVPQAVAAVLTLLVAFATIAAGLRYRVQTIAAIGVIGAFLPQMLVSWLSLRGFWLEPPSLLGYLALVDILVFALAARAGWSALDLGALCFTMITWQSTFPHADWSWRVTAGLAALFTGLGLAPLPQLVRVEGRVRSTDLAVVAGAPILLLVSLWSWLAERPSVPVAMLLFSLAALQWVAALWVDRQRSERDLWRPLTGAAIVFLTAGLQRLVGSENLALTWGLEGILLVLLGLAPRSGWLRLCGHTVLALAGCVTLSDPSWWQDVTSLHSGWYVGALRGAGVLALLATGATLLARRRAALAPLERWAPEAWTAAGCALFLLWSWRRVHEAVALFPWPAGAWWQGAWPPLASADAREFERFAALLALAWSLPAVAFAGRGARAGGGFLRTCAYGFALLVLGTLCVMLGGPDGWSPGQPPVAHPTSLAALASLALMFATAAGLASRRERLSLLERRAPEAWAGGFLLVTLSWWLQEARHVAITVVAGRSSAGAAFLLPAPVRTLAAALTSAGWLVEALTLLILGWLRSTAFLRWAGLLLIGVTVAKFTISDLANADVFWRFLTAIAAGAAMLAVSYAYQRRARSRQTAPPSPAPAAEAAAAKPE